MSAEQKRKQSPDAEVRGLMGNKQGINWHAVKAQTCKVLHFVSPPSSVPTAAAWDWNLRPTAKPYKTKTWEKTPQTKTKR